MTIATYANLKAKFTDASTNWMARSFSTDETDEFIDLAEGFLNTKLRCREMETLTDLAPTAGACTLPTDYLEYKRVVEKASIRRRLDYITEDTADSFYPSRQAGPSAHFMIIGGSLYPLPVTTNDIELTYYQKIPALSDANTTNWLLTRLPNLYLHATMLMAAEYISDTNMIGREAAFVERHIANLMELDNRSKFGNAGMTLSGAVW